MTVSLELHFEGYRRIRKTVITFEDKARGSVCEAVRFICICIWNVIRKHALWRVYGDSFQIEDPAFWIIIGSVCVKDFTSKSINFQIIFEKTIKEI